MSKSRALVCLLCIAVGFSVVSQAVTADRVTGPLSGGATVALKGNVHRKALPEFDAGAVDPAMKLGSITVLTLPTLAQRKALSQLVADQQNPKSPQYHKWLTPEQWADRFGLSHNDMGKITSWLKSQGFTITYLARGRNWVVVSGTAAQVSSTFGTEIHRFKVDGEMHVANATAPRIPSALAGVVSGIRGLDDFRLRPRAKVRPQYYSSGLNAQFVAPGDLATLYDINTLYNASTPIDGTGQKLAVIGQTDIYLSDITNFRTGFGLSAISCTTNSSGVITACSDPHFSYVVADGITDPGVPVAGDLSEADLDIELSGAIARNAQIIFVNAPTNGSGGNPTGGGVWNAWYYAVDQNLAPVISLSYGTCEFGDNFVLDSTGAPLSDELELQKANSQGITFVNSSGDTGVAECDTPSTVTATQLATKGLGLGYPASSPEVTAVGGTAVQLGGFTSAYWSTGANDTFGTSIIANSNIPQQGWNDDLEFSEYCLGSGSGSTFCTTGNQTGTAITSEQTAQNAISISSSGGGPSNCAQQTSDNLSCVAGFPKPSWQTVTLSGQPSVRYSPDISILASPNFPGYIFCTELSELGDTGTGSACGSGGATGITNALALPTPPLIGGTSASAPIFAGMVVLLNQYLGGTGLGNVNPKLYELAATPANGAFLPITTGDNNVYCSPGTPPAPMPASVQCPSTGVFGFEGSLSDTTTGYNLVTGLGSVDAANLASAWAASTVTSTFQLAPTSTVTTVSVTPGQTTSALNLTITSSNGFVSGGSTISPLTYTCSGLPSEATCNFSPSSTSSATSVSMTIVTTAPTGRLQNPLTRGTGVFYAVLFPGLMGIVVTIGGRKRSLSAIRMLVLITLLGVSAMWMSSCGGSSSSSNSNPGTPAGSYPITVTATPANTAIPANSFKFTLSVQ